MQSFFGQIILNFFKGMPKGSRGLFADITGVITTLLNILIVPLIAILTALLYLKTRQMEAKRSERCSTD